VNASARLRLPRLPRIRSTFPIPPRTTSFSFARATVKFSNDHAHRNSHGTTMPNHATPLPTESQSLHVAKPHPSLPPKARGDHCLLPLDRGDHYQPPLPLNHGDHFRSLPLNRGPYSNYSPTFYYGSYHAANYKADYNHSRSYISGICALLPIFLRVSSGEAELALRQTRLRGQSRNSRDDP